MNFYNFSNSTVELLNSLQNKSVKKTNSWMVSLGDLLTLLLCFILSLISYGHIKPINDTLEDTEKIEKKMQINQNTEVPKKRHSFGLEVASNSVSTEQFGEMSIYFSDFDFTDSEELTETALERLTLFLSENAERKLLLRSCAETDSWFGSLRQAVALRKALLATHFPRAQLEVELLGTGCDFIRTDENSNAVVKIEIKA